MLRVPGTSGFNCDLRMAFGGSRRRKTCEATAYAELTQSVNPESELNSNVFYLLGHVLPSISANFVYDLRTKVLNRFCSQDDVKT